MRETFADHGQRPAEANHSRLLALRPMNQYAKARVLQRIWKRPCSVEMLAP
jgi:hypothetical protein